ncbi:MAG: hypothetical protein ACI8X3_002006, partial [Saprospiraceae bacterium]
TVLWNRSEATSQDRRSITKSQAKRSPHHKRSDHHITSEAITF